MSSSSKDKAKSFGITGRSASLESAASVSSTASTSFSGKASSKIDLSDTGVTRYGQYLYNACGAVIYCSKHKKFALSKTATGKGLWLVYSPIRTSDGWYMSVCNFLKKILTVGKSSSSGKDYLSFKAPELIHTFRLQIPQFFEFITRVIFYTELTYDTRFPTSCCESNRWLVWCTIGEINRLNSSGDLWGPEPIVFAEALTGGHIEKGAYTEYTIRDATKYLPRDQPKTFQDEMLKSAGYTENDILVIYREFIQHCFPSQYMTLSSFSDYLSKIGWSSTDPDFPHYYRAFGFNRTPFLSFYELLLGLAAMDKSTGHGGHIGELRCGYIFRYYDRTDDQKLNYDEFKNLTRDIIKSRGKFDESMVDAEVTANYKSLSVNPKDPIDEQKLIKAIGTMQFRGTSPLFRSDVSALQQIRLKQFYGSIRIVESSMTDTKVKKAKGTCPKCKEKKYTLAVHIVRINSDGTVIEPLETNQSDVGRMSREKRAMSNHAFMSDTLSNCILDILHEYVESGAIAGIKVTGVKSKPNKLSWTNQASRIELMDRLLKICTDAEQLFSREPRVVKVNSPVYVLGDIHGNFHDLMVYERLLWKHGPSCTAANYLFLGDYVDRGEYGLECIFYLLAYKLIAPEKFFLLRGNHEIRAIQNAFTFRKECDEKFGRVHGPKLWESLNKTFDSMPICGIIDDSIFCSHGGIPTSAQKIEEINRIQVPLSDPESQNTAAWEILWNDPVTATEYNEYKNIIDSQPRKGPKTHGYLPNTKRGTAHYYSDDAVNHFLNTNGLSHVIRAHEVVPQGYQFHCKGKVITIFSSSKYCGGVNDAACILVDQEKIRIMRIET